MGVDPGLRRLALRTLLGAFAGYQAPEWSLALLADGLAGYVLFGRNVDHGGQVATLTGQLRATRGDVLIAIDEEGGDVTRLTHRTGSAYPGNAALGAVDDVDLTGRVYAAIGAELTAAGVNLNLAPVADVNTTDDNPIIGTRSFGAQPQLVARHSAAAVRGLQETGIAACAKHFPGHGATVADSHLTLPTVAAWPGLLRRRDLPPFAATVGAGVQAIMTAHIRVPGLTGAGPATFSRSALTDLLRGDYGFTGAVITDALEMKGAAQAAGGIGRAAVQALAAGADLLCMGADVDETGVEDVAAHIGRSIARGRLAAKRVEEAAARTAAMAAWASAPPPGSRPDRELGYAVARRAVRVEGDLPELSAPLVVQLDSGHSLAEGRVPWGLGPHVPGEQVRVAPAGMPADTVPAWADALRGRAGNRPLVVVGRNLHRSPAARALVERLAAGHPVVVVEMGWPAVWRPAGVRAFVLTYGASRASGLAAAEALGIGGSG